VIRYQREEGMPDGGMRGQGRGPRALAAAAGATLLLGFAATPSAAVQKDLTDKGEALVRENCSRCHAIGKEGDSPHPPAPPFRTLSSKYPVEDLAESLAEGIVSGHPDMPIFRLQPPRRRGDHRISQLDPGAARAPCRGAQTAGAVGQMSAAPSGHISQARAASTPPGGKCSTLQRMKGATRADQR
jgi:mono/diheme cytochrome c family protein